MQGRRRIDEILAVLAIGSAMDLDQQSSPQTGDADRGGQMIDGRRGEDGEPDRLKAGGFLDPEARQGAIELDRLHKSQPMAGERGQTLETTLRRGPRQRSAQILAEIARDREPVHHRASGGSGLHRGDRRSSDGWIVARFTKPPRHASRCRSEFRVPQPERRLAKNAPRSRRPGGGRHSSAAPRVRRASPASCQAPPRWR